MRLAEVDGDTIALLDVEYATMEDLRKAMRNDPEQFVGNKQYTLVGDRPTLTLTASTKYTIKEDK